MSPCKIGITIIIVSSQYLWLLVLSTYKIRPVSKQPWKGRGSWGPTDELLNINRFLQVGNYYLWAVYPLLYLVGTKGKLQIDSYTDNYVSN